MPEPETTTEPRHLSKEEIKNAVAATWKVAWHEFAVLPALCCIPGFCACLLLGLKFHNMGAGVMASSGAFTVGFGSFYRFRWSRAAPMVLATVGIRFSAFISAITEHTTLGFALVACAWAYLCGLLQPLGKGIWWISLQCVIFAMIASNFPVGFGNTVTKTLTVLGGALLQAVSILICRRLGGAKADPHGEAPDTIPFSTDAVKESARTFWSHLRVNLPPGTRLGRSALQLAVAVALSAAISRLVHLHNGYWMPMTAVIVMSTDWRQTFTKGLGRIVGTLVGGGLATLLAATLRPGPYALVALVVTFAFLSYLLLRVNYAVYAIFITSYVVFQLASVGLPTAALVPARIIATVLGGVLALLIQFVWPLSTGELREPSSEHTGSA